MSHLDPIAYTYEADHHCPDCTFKRFGRNEHGYVPEDATDNEGNRVGAVAPWDEWWEPSEPGRQVLTCGDCGAEIAVVVGEKEDDDDDEFDEEQYKAELWVILKANGCTCQPEIKLDGDQIMVKHEDGCARIEQS